MKNIFDKKFNTQTGWLALDFANTAGWHASASPEEKLLTYADLVTWAKNVLIVLPETADKLLALANSRTGEAAAVLSRAIELREAIYRIMSRKAHGLAADFRDLAVLNATIAKEVPNLVLQQSGSGFDWDWKIDPARLDSILVPVVWSAAGLLTGDSLERVGQCADEKGCGWLFFDTSRNRTRRWCDMQDCGNRAKSKRHYLRASTK
jgi:predicted RNA-binding Zn ribbon-like protein